MVAMETSKGRRPVTVLIVEDERLVARDLERSLAEVGYEVLSVASSYDEALGAAGARVPNIVLMDIRLRGQPDGIEAAATLRERFGVPVLYLTAYADDETLARAARTQPYGYIIKPFTSKEVRSAIELALYKHEMDSRLVERERWLATTLRAIHDGVIACDDEEHIQLMNPVAERLTGWQEADAKGRPVRDVFHVETGSPGEDLAARALVERRVHTAGRDATLVPRAGQERWLVELTAAPIVHDAALLGAVLVFRDVTEARRLADHVALNERLATLGLMAAGLGHEINNPLAANVANIGYARGELRSIIDDAERGIALRLDPVLEALDEADEAGARIRKIVDDLRVFSRPRAAARRPVDVTACLEWALKLAHNEIRNTARLVKDIGVVPAVMGDEVRLSQVFLNMLVNATQAIVGPPGDNEIRVVVYTDAEGRAVVEVHDTGSGIAPEVLRRIFDPFFTTKPLRTASGLGLSISRSIVTSLGGELTVDAARRGGTCFRVVLPPCPPDEPREPVAPAPAPARAARARLLIIDDDELVGSALGRMLEKHHDVTLAGSARGALALLASAPPFDLILCDLMMPDQSGMDFYDILQRTIPDLVRRIAFMTGGAFSPRAIEFLASVQNPHIEKPLQSAAMMAFVDECLRKLERG